MNISKGAPLATPTIKTFTIKSDSAVLAEIQALPNLVTSITSYTSNLGVSKQVTWNGTPTDQDLSIVANYFGTGNDSSFV